MMVVGHAYRSEVEHTRARDRAVARLSVITSECRLAGISDYARDLSDHDWRRYLRAQVAASSLAVEAFAAFVRHRMWHRAYRRARRREAAS
jgi:hypothetical protein